MEGSRFDAWTRRRVGLTAGTLLAGLAGIAPLAGLAKKGKKKKKKCKKPKVKCGKKCCPAGQSCRGGKCAAQCRFVTAGSVMTLQADCTTTTSIEIPDGGTLDGNGKTLTMANTERLFPAVMSVVDSPNPATLRNLTIVGLGESSPCVPTISFAGTGGRIENVTVRGVNCGGIHAGSSVLERQIDIVDATLSDMLSGITVAGFTGSISGCTLRTVGGIVVSTPGTVTVEDNEVIDANFGVEVSGGNAVVRNNTLMRLPVGIAVLADAVAQVTDNTIVGPGETGTAGIVFNDGASGTVEGNTISNYLAADACGIRLEPDAGDVTVNDNTFPAPGNEEDECGVS